MSDETEVKSEEVAPAAPRDRRWLDGTWRKISLAVLGAFVTFASGAFELCHKAIDNIENRSTVAHLNTLALRAIERGEYAAAGSYLQTALAITPTSVSAIEEMAALKTLQLAEAQYKAGDAIPDDIIEQLEEVGLSRDEANFCIAVCTYSRGGTPEIRQNAEGFLNAVTDNEPRLAMLRRARLAAQVLLPRINDQLPLAQRQTIVATVSRLLQELDIRLKQPPRISTGFFFASDNERNAFTDGMRREVSTIRRLLENEEVKLASLQKKAPLSSREEKQLVATLQTAQSSVPANSPLFASIGDQLVRYSSQADEEAPSASSDKLEVLRRQAIDDRRNGDWQSAKQKLGEVITTSAGVDSATLYKTYFGLALIAEYQEHRLDAADDYYSKAEAIRARLKAGDPSLPNTYGYFWYKRARDTHDAELRKQYAEKAREQFKKALAIDPGYTKSVNSMDGLQRLLSNESKAESPS